MRKTDIADKYSIKKMFMKVLNNRSNILIISGDIDFVTAIDGLRERNTFIMLALLQSSRRDFYARAKVTWVWSSEDPNNAFFKKKFLFCSHTMQNVKKCGGKYGYFIQLMLTRKN